MVLAMVPVRMVMALKPGPQQLVREWVMALKPGPLLLV